MRKKITKESYDKFPFRFINQALEIYLKFCGSSNYNCDLIRLKKMHNHRNLDEFGMKNILTNFSVIRCLIGLQYSPVKEV